MPLKSQTILLVVIRCTGLMPVRRPPSCSALQRQSSCTRSRTQPIAQEAQCSGEPSVNEHMQRAVPLTGPGAQDGVWEGFRGLGPRARAC